jgi:Bifunctional DNA primase/polymerase, N-terminal
MTVFARLQPTYAEHGIATFPLKPGSKIPAVRGYDRVGKRGSRSLVERFPDATGLGFMCGPRTKVTVFDIDTTDEAALKAGLDRHGMTPLTVQTASGKFHNYYRHSGEGRLIRPWRDLPVDILGGGQVVAATTALADGGYKIIRGTLEDLQSLPVMQNVTDVTRDVTPTAPDARSMKAGDGRNRALWEWCMRRGAGFSIEQMTELARTENQTFKEPMMDAEVLKIATSAWDHDAAGLNFYSRPRVMINHDTVDSLARTNSDAVA